ncbi:Crp/Fnr family transcriptional regulator [Rhodohalobacter halophilus]|uniref:Crp/Fnr family transcriptional regulator n=1 Tax=Rhodohalobacter halophilus TaxID=1812810 RepID=UPI000B2B430D|nr:Crp/Fnr family transcriptional regulator [Rhodohalobacter halophilus]
MIKEQESINKLKSISEFKASEEFLSDLKRYGQIKKMDAGDILFEENTSIRAIPIILKGSVKVYQSDDDFKELLLYYLKEGDTCIMSVLNGLYNESNQLKAVANEKSEVLLLPVQKLGILTKNHPEWIDYIFRIYHQRFQELLDVVNAVAFKKMDERLLRFLKKRSEVSGKRSIKITHEELANELGTARVVISRLLKQMEGNKLVRLSRNKITLL